MEIIDGEAMVGHVHLLVSISLEDKRIKFHRASERKECTDDIWQACEPEI